MTTIDKLFLDAETNDEFIRQLMSSVVLATKESSNAPKGTDFEYYAMSPKFKSNATKTVSETLALIDKIVGLVKPDRQISLPDDIRDPVLYEQIVDAIDTLLEGADKYLDGPKKESKLKNSVNQSMSLDKGRLAVQNIKDLRKPQTDFLSDIDNIRQNPFCPRIKSDKVKYHGTAKLDLKPKKVPAPAEGDESLIGPQTYFAHPYETELRNLSFPAWCAVESGHVSTKPTYSQEPFTLVETEAAFQQMLAQLQGAKELAVDLEHHSHHTFQGLTCLIQISSRDYDFLVDTLALRHLLPQLGQFFADPSVVKVLHGCDKDVLWLQRDCGLYLVNCFDTHVAAKALNYPALSLAHLLKMHCGVNADKKHQLSDWRVRPLSPEMQHYAKEDTHFLLYIFDRMRAELSKKLGRAGLEHVFDASRQLCLARYEKEAFDPLGYRKLFKENATSRAIPKLEDLTSVQDAALAAVWDWRDRTARTEDESVAALMSNSELLRIGLHLPQTGVQLEQQCGPLSAHTRKCTAEILKLIADVSSVGAFASASASASKKGGSVVPAIDVPHSYTSPRSKKTKILDTGDNATVSKTGVIDTAYTFTPAVLASPDMSQRTRPSIENITSPVLRADEIFQHAGWSTPQHKVDLDRPSYSPNIFDTGRNVVSMESHRRMQKSQEELSKMYAAKEDHLFHSRLNALAFQTDEAATQQAGDASSAAPSNAPASAGSNTTTALVGGETMEVPKSFEEVHQLSQRNRQRQKDQRLIESKVRQRKAGEEENAELMDVVASDSQVWDQKALKAAKVDPNFYFSATSDADIDCGVDSTLELARDLGWVRSEEEGAAIKDAHLQDLSYQQAEGAEADAQSGNPLRKSQEGKSKSSGSSRSAPGPLRTSGEGSLSGTFKASKGYDYSKVPNTFVGALPVNQAPVKEESGRSGSSGRNGKNKNQKNKHSDTLTSNNPYLFGSSVNK